MSQFNLKTAFARLRKRLRGSVPVLLSVFLLLGVCGGCGDDSEETDTDMLVDVIQDQDEEVDTIVDTDTSDGDDGDTDEDTEVDMDVPDQDTSDGDDTEDVVACDPACGDNQECVEGTCECVELFADCDMDDSNGCEQSLSEVDHCGMCETEGLNCSAHGIQAICTPPMQLPGQGICEINCLNGYFNLDAVDSNGCETGLPLNATADLSGDLPGTVLDVAVEDDQAWVLVDDGTLKIVPLYLNEGMVSTGTLVDTGATASGRSRLAVSNGLVAVSAGGNLLFVYFDDGATMTLIDDVVWSGISDVAPVAIPVTANATAEFIATGSNGSRWWGAYPDGMQPSGLPGGSCSGASAGLVLCRLATDGNPSDGAAVEVPVFNGAPYAVAVGESSTVEQEFSSAPGLSPLLVNGDDLPATLVDADVASTVVYVLNGDGVDAYDYSFNMLNKPSSRSVRSLITLMATPSSLAVLDDDRMVVGADDGLRLLYDNGAVALTSLFTDVAALDSDGVRLVVIDGAKEVSVHDVDLVGVE